MTLHTDEYRIADNTAIRDALWTYLIGYVPLGTCGDQAEDNRAAVEAALEIIVGQRARNAYESWGRKE